MRNNDNIKQLILSLIGSKSNCLSIFFREKLTVFRLLTTKEHRPAGRCSFVFSIYFIRVKEYINGKVLLFYSFCNHYFAIVRHNIKCQVFQFPFFGYFGLNFLSVLGDPGSVPSRRQHSSDS